MKKRWIRNISFWALVVMAACCLPVFSQTITANVGGTVTDSSGSVLSGATVAATNIATNVSVSTKTNASGTYSIRFLQIGQYKITIEAQGFATSSYGPYTLEISQIARVDAQLKIGSTSDTVVVSSAIAPILNTENSQVDTTFSENTIKNIPLNGQNFSAIMQYMPGAVSPQPANMTGVGAVERMTGASGAVSVNGNRLQANNYLWDGVEINETVANLIGYSPSPEAIGEMKVISANPNAEYGNASGGNVIAVMKSGSNHMHGSVFGFLQNWDLNANTWANKNVAPGSAPADRSHYTQSQFGGSIGGAILKDKLFYFADFAAGRIHSGGPQPLYVASAKMRQGDFSELLDPNLVCYPGDSTTTCNGRKIQLYDPNNNYAPYVGNKGVPIVNPVAKYLYAHPELYPLPNHAPDPGNPVGQNFFGYSNSYNSYNQGDVRVDWTPTAKDRFFFHYTQAEGNDGTPNYPVPVFFQQSNKYPDKIFAVGNVHTFSTSVVNEFRAGYSRIRFLQGAPNDTTGTFGTNGNSIVGISNNGRAQPFAGFAAQQVSGLNTPGATAGAQIYIDNTFHYTEALTWSHGKHNSKFGAELVRYQQNYFYPGDDGALGSFTYNGNFTSNPFIGSQGYSVTDFVLDRVFQEKVGGVAGPSGQRQWRTAYYAQDDWRALPKLTLNLGLRYEYDQPIYEVNNKMSSVNFTTGQVQYAGSIPALNPYPGATVCATRSCYNANYNNVMPRLGFAYSATDRFVVRGGYGITTFLEGTGVGLRLTQNQPFIYSLELKGTPPTTTGTGQYFSVENGFSASAVPTYSSSVLRAYSPNLKPAFTQTFSLSTQYQVNNQSSLTVAYIGETGQHLIQAVYSNQLKAPCVLNGIVQSNPNTAACTAADPAPFQALVGQSGQVKTTASEAAYNYNALQASYRQRPVAGLEYNINYTYGRAMSNSSGFFGDTGLAGRDPYAQNAYDNHSEYSPTGTDVRNSLNGTLVYDLPFGRGRKFGVSMNRVLDEVVGGWKLASAGVVYSGLPVSLSGSDNSGTNAHGGRPNQYFQIPVKNRSKLNWYGNDPSAQPCTSAGARTNQAGAFCAYGNAAVGTFGTARPASLRAPKYQNFDLSLSKDFTIFREQKIGFRADGFNVLNMTALGNPSSSTDTNFGLINSVRNQERRIQFSGRYQF